MFGIKVPIIPRDFNQQCHMCHYSIVLIDLSIPNRRRDINNQSHLWNHQQLLHLPVSTHGSYNNKRSLMCYHFLLFGNAISDY